jgi:uncharacterized protein YjdB
MKRSNMHSGLGTLGLLVVTLLAGCEANGGGGGGGGPTEPPTSVPTTISVSPSSASLASLGATQQFTATVKDQTGATMTGLTVSWSSSTSSVAEVSSSGLATAVDNGSTNVTATLLAISGSASLQVQQSVAELRLSADSVVFVSLGDAQTFGVEILDALGSVVTAEATLASDSTVWSSTDTQVVTVDQSGSVTAVGPGQAEVIAQWGTIQATLTATVRQSVAALRLSADSVLFVSLGEAQTIGVEILDALGSVVTSEATLASDSTVWNSTDTQVVTVDQSGSVTAVGPGQAEVIAQWGMIQATLTATVRQQATSLSVSPMTLSFSATGDTARLVVSATDAGGSAIDQPTVVWTSSDDSVVSVVDGLVTSVANGTAMITATSGSASAEVEANVLLLAELPIVIVVGEKGISAEAAADTVAVGGTTQMSASVTDEEGNPLSVTVRWASSNPAIATVDETGLVTGVYAGTTKIVATYAGVSGARTITVTQN